MTDTDQQLKSLGNILEKNWTDWVHRFTAKEIEAYNNLFGLLNDIDFSILSLPIESYMAEETMQATWVQLTALPWPLSEIKNPDPEPEDEANDGELPAKESPSTGGPISRVSERQSASFENHQMAEPDRQLKNDYNVPENGSHAEKRNLEDIPCSEKEERVIPPTLEAKQHQDRISLTRNQAYTPPFSANNFSDPGSKKLLITEDTPQKKPGNYDHETEIMKGRVPVKTGIPNLEYKSSEKSPISPHDADDYATNSNEPVLPTQVSEFKHRNLTFQPVKGMQELGRFLERQDIVEDNTENKNIANHFTLPKPESNFQTHFSNANLPILKAPGFSLESRQIIKPVQEAETQAPAPSVSDLESPFFPFENPEHRIPETDDILDALAEKLSREYKRFYGP